MTSFAVLVIVKATLVCGVAFVLSRMCRRTRASIRHLLFALAFVALVAIPAAGPIVPTVAVTVPAAAMAPAYRPQDIASATPSSPGADASSSSTLSISREAAAARFVTIARVVTAAWLMGVALFLVPVVVGFWQMRRLRARALPWTDGQARAQRLLSALGVRRPVAVLLHDAVTGPMTCGVLTPSIILPVSAQEWDEASLGCALRHELEHVARWDFLTLCLSRMVCAVYWFHPLVWAAWRRLRLEAERACDDAVVREDDARDYAALLVSMAQREPAGARRPLLAMAGRNDLAARVAAVLDHEQMRGRVGRRRATGLIVAAALVILGVAPITIARAMPQTPAAAAPSQTFAAASIKRNPTPEMRQVDGRLVANNVTVRQLLNFAYGVGACRDDLDCLRDIDNGPWWLNFYRFDIVASMPSDNRPWQGSKSLQAFLTERFKLVAHRGSKEFPIYALVQARTGGSLGPQMTPSQRDCRSDATCGISSSDGRLAGRGVTLAELTRNLPTHLGSVPGGRQLFDRELMDRTGLGGRFDFILEWTLDTAVRSTVATPAPSQNRPFASVLESTAFLKALEEQLGLTIESQLATKPVLVIDSIEEPAGN